MPRIPARTEPYENSARQQRHYKTKRDQSLKALEKAAYIGRSHFAILFINARGQVECYSTKLLAPRLDDWFNQDVIAQAEDLVRFQGGENPFDVERSSRAPPDDSDDCTPPSPGTPGSPSKTQHAALPPNLPAEAIPFCSQHGVSNAYYSKVFEKLTGDVIRKIGKCWTESVHPGGDVDKPVGGGDNARPRWWPAGVPHSDPSHLRKPNGVALLVAVIRSGVVSMEELGGLTFASDHMRDIDRHALSLLRELFVVAQGDEILRRKSHTQQGYAEASLLAMQGGPYSHDQHPAASVLFSSGGATQTAEEAEMWNGLIDDTQMGSPTPPADFAPHLSTKVSEAEASSSSPLAPTSPLRRTVPVAFNSPFAIRRKEAGNSTESRRTSPRSASKAAVVAEASQPAVSVSAQRSGLVFPTPEWPTGALPTHDAGGIHSTGDPHGIPKSPSSPKRGTPSKHQPAGRPQPGKLHLDNLPRYLAGTPWASPDDVHTPGTVMTPGYSDAPDLTPYSQTPFNVYGGQASDGYFDFTPGSAWSSDSPQRMVFPSPRYPTTTFAFSDEVPTGDGQDTSEYFPHVPNNNLLVEGFMAPTRNSSMVTQYTGSLVTMSSESSFCGGEGGAASYMLQPSAEIVERQPNFHHDGHAGSNSTQASAQYDDPELGGRSWIVI